jgi:superfamily II DNA or RNA helicase
MNYNEIITIIEKINEKIFNLRQKHKTMSDDMILSIIEEFYSDDIPSNILMLININYNWVIKCLKYIKKYIKLYSKKYEYGEIIIQMDNYINTSNSKLNNFYQDIFIWLNNLNIIKNLYDEDEKDNSETEEFKFRINQLDAFEKLEKNGLQKGILNSATGTGKSYIILKYIDYTYRKFKNNCKIILFTERVSILKDLFELDNNDKLQSKIAFWKKNNIADISDIKIIDRVTIKKYDWIDYFINNNNNRNRNLLNRNNSIPTLLLINRAFLSNNELYKQLTNNDISLVIHDECHNATSSNCFNIIKHFNDINIPVVGFSATPVRTGQKQIEKIKSIYGDGEKINLIIDYGLIFAIDNKLIVPPVFNWYYFDNFIENEEQYTKITDIEVDSILTCLDQKIDDLPYRKMIAWCGFINLTKEWLFKFINNYKKYKKLHTLKFYVDLDCQFNIDINNNNDFDIVIGTYKDFKEIDSDGILFCAKKHKEGSDIKNLDSCIFLDKAKNREPIPFIQCIGRVLRNNTNKKCGYIFDGLITNDYKNMIDKIIDYYQTIQNLTNINELTNNENNDRITKMSESITYTNNKINLHIGKTIITIDTMKLKLDERKFKKLTSELRSRKKIINCRDPLLCMNDNEKLRHRSRDHKNNIWEFYYNKPKNCFVYNDKEFKNMNQITSFHYKLLSPNRTSNNNAWCECEIYRNEEWISTHNLPLI